MDMQGEGEDRGRADAAAMSAGQQAAFGDGISGGADGRRVPGEHQDAARDDDAQYDGRDEDHSGLVGGGPAEASDAADDPRAGAGEVAADRARAEEASVTEEEAGLAPGESD
ncbi:hypothetical protein AVP42_02469 [Agromyces sp. NDB4Y10]|uniref:hypothetical protein n=1 Tax=Agromyces sp. NDB4Y10 TaxID=1775951 RepID=UPI0007B26092|nr:hypothetical protein [Agromyces sp. NDB4Y10]KZE92317.1 hypothetical protein AVP42_02469 [Agromyces sp. NDB4Y10]